MSGEILIGDCRAVMATLPERSVQTCITSPPYWGLRDYGVDGQIGLEATADAFVATMVDVFRAVRRVLADDGTLWLNLGDRGGEDRPALARTCEVTRARVMRERLLRFERDA